jgi:hypothetical protein
MPDSMVYTRSGCGRQQVMRKEIRTIIDSNEELEVCAEANQQNKEARTRRMPHLARRPWSGTVVERAKVKLPALNIAPLASISVSCVCRP